MNSEQVQNNIEGSLSGALGNRARRSVYASAQSVLGHGKLHRWLCPAAPGWPAVNGLCRRSSDGFSLIEVMVAVTILTVITVGLLMMFNQTQQAFRSSLTQTDVTQSGRVVSDMVASELAQITASGVGAANFVVRVPAGSFLQALPPSAAGTTRTNVCQDVFFLTCVNHQWTAIGYRVFPPNAGAATLYRFSTNIPASPPTRFAQRIGSAVSLFLNANPTNAPAFFSRMADGVIHFRVRAFGTQYLTNLFTGEIVFTNHGARITRPITNEQGNVIIVAWPDNFNPPTGEYNYTFLSNALPMLVELEIGVVEPPTLERMRALADSPVAARRFLAERPQTVHLYRQLIRVREADSAPYKFNLARYQ